MSVEKFEFFKSSLIFHVPANIKISTFIRIYLREIWKKVKIFFRYFSKSLFHVFEKSEKQYFIVIAVLKNMFAGSACPRSSFFFSRLFQNIPCINMEENKNNKINLIPAVLFYHLRKSSLLNLSPSENFQSTIFKYSKIKLFFFNEPPQILS